MFDWLKACFFLKTLRLTFAPIVSNVVARRMEGSKKQNKVIHLTDSLFSFKLWSMVLWELQEVTLPTRSNAIHQSKSQKDLVSLIT